MGGTIRKPQSLPFDVCLKGCIEGICEERFAPPKGMKRNFRQLMGHLHCFFQGMSILYNLCHQSPVQCLRRGDGFIKRNDLQSTGQTNESWKCECAAPINAEAAGG